MSQIDSGQGAVKLSEVSVDNAQTLLNTPERQDAMTVLEKLRQVTTDALRRIGLLLVSQHQVSGPGQVNWTQPNIQLTSGTNIVVKLLQNEIASVIDLIMTYGVANSATSFNSIVLNNNEILYIELDRTNIASGPVVLQNAVGGGSLIAGKTVKKASSLPALVNSDSNQATMLIPLVINLGGSLWWIPHGIFWNSGVGSPLGAVVTSTSMPIGSIVPMHLFGDMPPLSYVATKLLAPGWQLCNGSLVIDEFSPRRNPTRNIDGTSSGGTNYSLDKFTPNLNGPSATWSSAVTYVTGDQVSFNGIDYYCKTPCLNITPPNTTYWGDPTTATATPYYRTSVNQSKNTYIRGSNQPKAGNDINGHGGSNAQTLTTVELPNHTHTADAVGTHNHNTTGSGGEGIYGWTGTMNQGLTHTHTGTTVVSDGAHYHRFAVWNYNESGPAPGGGNRKADGNADKELAEDTWMTNYYGNMPTPISNADQGGHSHTLSINPNNSSSSIDHNHHIGPDGDHTHTINPTGGGQPKNYEPCYFNTIYIVRIY